MIASKVHGKRETKTTQAENAIRPTYYTQKERSAPHRIPGRGRGVYIHTGNPLDFAQRKATGARNPPDHAGYK